jgi:RNA-directed DNA polymerase
MRLPQLLLNSQFFIFPDLPELIKALGNSLLEEELSDINRMVDLGLPPISSRHVLATMFGVSTGLIRSFEHNPSKHYRSFKIPKGKLSRTIDAPRVALKVVQKWISVQLMSSFNTPDNVFGFVSGRSHLEAARLRLLARRVNRSLQCKQAITDTAPGYA